MGQVETRGRAGSSTGPAGGVPWEVTSLQRCAPAGGLYPMGKGSLQEGMAPLDHSISTQRADCSGDGGWPRGHAGTPESF